MSSASMTLVGLRGATTCGENSVEAIEAAVEHLIATLINENDLSPDRIVSVTFSVTADLDACFPAAVARRGHGWETVALLDCQQMQVQGDLPRCIRLLALAWIPVERPPVHPYQGEAQRLRPDRSGHN